MQSDPRLAVEFGPFGRSLDDEFSFGGERAIGNIAINTYICNGLDIGKDKGSCFSQVNCDFLGCIDGDPALVCTVNASLNGDVAMGAGNRCSLIYYPFNMDILNNWRGI